MKTITCFCVGVVLLAISGCTKPAPPVRMDIAQKLPVGVALGYLQDKLTYKHKEAFWGAEDLTNCRFTKTGIIGWGVVMQFSSERSYGAYSMVLYESKRSDFDSIYITTDPLRDINLYPHCDITVKQKDIKKIATALSSLGVRQQ